MTYRMASPLASANLFAKATNASGIDWGVDMRLSLVAAAQLAALARPSLLAVPAYCQLLAS